MREENTSVENPPTDKGNNDKMHSAVLYISTESLDNVAKDLKMDPVYVEKVRREIRAQKLIFLAVKDGGRYIASVALCIGEADEQYFQDNFTDYAAVYSLLVSEQERGRHVATDLMDFAEVEAQRQGKTGVVLGVAEDNLLARKMYEKRGYEYIQTDKNNTIESHWDVTDKSGARKHVVVDLMPMKRDL